MTPKPWSTIKALRLYFKCFVRYHLSAAHTSLMELNLQHAWRVLKTEEAARLKLQFTHCLCHIIPAIYSWNEWKCILLFWQRFGSRESLLLFVIHGSLVNMKPDSNFRAGQSRGVQIRIKKIFSSLSQQVFLNLLIDPDNNVFSFDSEICSTDFTLQQLRWSNAPMVTAGQILTQ